MNEEFSHWISLFKEKDFEQRLLFLKKELKDKKVVLYCNGVFFDALTECYNLKDFFNIAGISDMRYQSDFHEVYKNFRCIKPSSLKNIDFETILITSPSFESVKKYLEKNNLCKKSVEILPIQVEENSYKLEQQIILKNNYKKVLENLKNKRNNNEKIRVLFVCEENSKWGYQFVYEKMKLDNDFEILPVVLYPIVTKNRIEFTQKENLEFFKKQGIDSIDGYDYEKKKNKDIKSFQPDLVFYQQPWYLQGNNHPKSVSEFALTMMIPYGYTTLSEEAWGNSSVKDVYTSLWTFFSESPYHNDFYEKAAGMQRENLYAAGSAKLDYYRTPIGKKFEKIWREEDKNKKRIIWAPHHSVCDAGLGMSNFQEQYKFFLNFAKKHREYSFILKPHPSLRSMCISTGFLTEKEYDTYIQEWKNLPNADVYTLGNYFDIFKTSDILLTDCSSFLAEYFPAQKPIVLLDRKNRAPFDKFGEIIKQGFYRIEKTEEIERLLYEILVQGNDTLKPLRQEILNSYFYIPQKSASDRIVEFIKNLLFIIK